MKIKPICILIISFIQLCFIYTVNAQQDKKQFMCLDTDRDGQISESELPNSEDGFNKLDKNADGFLSMRKVMPSSRQKQQKNDTKWTVDIWKKGKACNGTTLFGDKMDPSNPGFVEVDMEGKVIWEYRLPVKLKEYIVPGMDVERLPNGNTLFVCPRSGVYEVNKEGNIVWSHRDNKISHDADRLPNGNTIYVFGALDKKRDAQVTEVDKDGRVVWEWHVNEHLDELTYNPHHLVGGLTHTDAVTRLPNGNTLISLRNFNCLVEVNKKGDITKTIGKGIIYYPHDPELLCNGDILVTSQYPLFLEDSNYPGKEDKSVFFYPVLQFNPETSEISWLFNLDNWKDENLTCDADRLPNGNTLILTLKQIVEVTPENEIVWRLRANESIKKRPRWHSFEKMQRIVQDK